MPGSIDWPSLAEETAARVAPVWQEVDRRVLANTARVLAAFQECRVSEYHFHGSTGYGYGDAGRNTLEAVFARVFAAERALVHPSIVSGTHALAITLLGLLTPGEELLSPYGAPYDTLEGVIGRSGGPPGSLSSLGISYRQVDPLPDGTPDWTAIEQAVNARTGVVLLQRSGGYSARPALDLAAVGELTAFVRRCKKVQLAVVVDNCYGEFVEAAEPLAVGADLIAGSLIKNPGGGLAPAGGYVAGRAGLVERAAARLTAPGLGGAVGPAPGGWRLHFQGLFQAPHAVGEALKGAVFTACLAQALGLVSRPAWDTPRTDIIQAVDLGRPELVQAFCRGLQSHSPVDAHVVPEPGPLAGYGGPVIMAAGTFVQGASLELTADAPFRPPYTVYLQGGLALAHVRLAVQGALQAVLELL
ncbi:MAG TPA: methionine gamma-lyase family protein [Spirochaetia bacterium]|nr:methionine gamma-lyase family protein [Spirochaetia bacterium]